ncbi:STAS domain-containing protein [Synechococcales cyanobacterium C]|uniref:STAS domain-containing protein n=1 Tax=Petrachloros mirabilis ULC683 TaxID=2781853 RepID=A0A8K1ZY71_9CYAN|nr:SulP family inorganic anion transporter [Petrachloros mirabilis]NCJ06283.1 STAS domain-containing protein [Petrachloros mirabilis ULC683]
MVNPISFHHLRGDLFGGLTAAIVALPLALAFGVASGAGAISGLYGAIFLGLFASLLGGTPAQVSGPTGPMTVVITTVIATLVARHPETGLAMAFTVVMLGGVFQILLGVLRLGQYITLMPYTVISGFMSGVGVIIIVLQIPPLLGYTTPSGIWRTLQQLPQFLSQPNLLAAGLGLFTLTLVKLAPPRLNRILPAPLLALIAGTLISVIFLGQGAVPRIGSIPTGLPELKLPTLTFSDLRIMVSYGLMLGTLGSIDSLLTSLVADNITRTQHNPDKELIGQGIGNCLAGLFGGLPGAGATMRTVTNVQAGGRTPLSGIFHALTLLLITLGAGSLTTVIPHAVLAGLLIKVGLDIIDWSFIQRAPRLSFKATGLMYLVLSLTVFVDLITAVVVGVFIANILTLKRLTDIQTTRVRATSDPTQAAGLEAEEQELLTQAQGNILLFQLGGPLSFGAAKTLSQRLSIVQDYQVLLLDLSDVPVLGVTTALAIETMVEDAAKRQRHVFVVASFDQPRQRLRDLKLQRFAKVQILDNRLEALQAASALLSVKTT